MARRIGDGLRRGRQGEMSYLARNIDERVDLTVKFPWAKSVICVAVGLLAGEWRRLVRTHREPLLTLRVLLGKSRGMRGGGIITR